MENLSGALKRHLARLGAERRALRPARGPACRRRRSTTSMCSMAVGNILRMVKYGTSTRRSSWPGRPAAGRSPRRPPAENGRPPGSTCPADRHWAATVSARPRRSPPRAYDGEFSNSLKKRPEFHGGAASGVALLGPAQVDVVNVVAQVAVRCERPASGNRYGLMCSTEGHRSATARGLFQVDWFAAQLLRRPVAHGAAPQHDNRVRGRSCAACC